MRLGTLIAAMCTPHASVRKTPQTDGSTQEAPSRVPTFLDELLVCDVAKVRLRPSAVHRQVLQLGVVPQDPEPGPVQNLSHSGRRRARATWLIVQLSHPALGCPSAHTSLAIADDADGQLTLTTLSNAIISPRLGV